MTEQKNSDELIFEYVHNPNLDMYQVCQYIYIYIIAQHYKVTNKTKSHFVPYKIQIGRAKNVNIDLVLLQSTQSRQTSAAQSSDNQSTSLNEKETSPLDVSTGSLNRSSRFAARIVMEKTGLQRSYIFAGAFDTNHEINIGVKY